MQSAAPQEAEAYFARSKAMLWRVRKHAPHAIEHASIVAFALKRLIKPPSPREGLGVGFRDWG